MGLWIDDDDLFAIPFKFSPNAKRLRFTSLSLNYRLSLWEVGIDGSGLRQLPSGFQQDEGECCGRWSADGRYYFFAFHRGRTDIWALREKAGMFRPGSPDPFPITTGPLDYFARLLLWLAIAYSWWENSREDS